MGLKPDGHQEMETEYQHNLEGRKIWNDENDVRRKEKPSEKLRYRQRRTMMGLAKRLTSCDKLFERASSDQEGNCGERPGGSRD